MTSVLGIAAVWDGREVSSEPPRERVRQLTALMQRLHDERIAAEELLSELKGTPSGWQSKLALISDLDTIGAIDGLLEVFNVFNHENYGSYTTAESNANYGLPSQNTNWQTPVCQLPNLRA